jgi:orsellinic acid C2-O-methyltransferase
MQTAGDPPDGPAPVTGVRARMQQLIYGFVFSQGMYVAARLGLADVLADGPRTTRELAAATGAHEPSLYRLLRALAFAGLVHQPAPDTFALTEQGELLRSGLVGSLRELVLLLAGPESWRAWGQLEHSVRTGDVAWQHVFGETCFDHLAREPDRQAGFNAAMAEGSRAFVPTLLAATDLAAADQVVDVGGGSGALLAGILSAHPRLAGVLLDTAPGLADAPRTLAQAGVADRCRLVAGDFFQSIPAGADAYLLKHVLHDWDDERCVGILTTCRRAMPAGAVLLVIESLMPATVSGLPQQAQLVMNDLNMMVCHGGRERTVAEFGGLLRQAGLQLESVTPCPAPSTVGILEARPAGAVVQHTAGMKRALEAPVAP